MTQRHDHAGPHPEAHDHPHDQLLKADHTHAAGDGAPHHHIPQGIGAERKIFVTLVLTGGFMVAEVVGGLLSGSLALIADAGHMATDFAALMLAYAGIQFGKRPADALRSYGYRRVEVLAAFINGLTLLALTAWIVVEGVIRLFAPVEVLSGPMMIVAVLGLLVNVASFAILRKGAAENVNISSALVHVLGDLLGSLATIAAAAVIWLTGWTPIDPILSLVVAALIVRSGWVITRRAGHILLEGTPPDLDVEEIKRTIAEEDGVRSTSHLHVWSLTSGAPVATLHLCLEEGAAAAVVLERVKQRLHQRFGIAHSTVEIDFDLENDARLRQNQ